MDLLAALKQSVTAAKAVRPEPTQAPTEGDPTGPRPNEWYGIGAQAQFALLHAYYDEQTPGRPMTTGASIGMPGMVRAGNVAETPQGPRLTDRGRAVLGQHPGLLA